MQRYTVTVVSQGSPGERPTLLVPFEPSAIVAAFIDELFRRVTRQGIALAPNTHVATIHVDSEGGAIIDAEDILADVVPNPAKEKLFAVFIAKQKAAYAQQAQPTGKGQLATGEDAISVRIITPALAQGKDEPSILQLPASATVKQLHEIVAEHLHVTATSTDKDDTNVCNCNLARQLADAASPPTHFPLTHGKSKVDRIELAEATEDGLKTSVRAHLREYFESARKLHLFGPEQHTDNVTLYKKSPVVAVSKSYS
ncbi:hypothetical protein B0A55_07454 [Friedmanniomyces simplex]|uniref:Par3/HAL N-terminal domain-containing protein n=1 Tax=Friedmanniomyces simplex TaxID=329884 RepID=A0A4U0X4I8_9PEZI|nr:hypothetical protein B0A55_07454 [Friedmanniomyces simplex]